MFSFRRIFAELWAGIILLTPGICQEAPDKIIRITVNLVQLDAVVTDSKGRQVTDLESKDFEVLQDGEPQKITHFSYVSTETSRPVARAENNTPATPPSSRSPIRTIALVVDDLGLSFESTVRVRDALRKFVNEQIVPGDLVAIIRTSGGMGALEQFTRDKRQLSAAIDRIHFNALARAAMGEPAPPVPRESAEVRSSATELDDFRESVFAVGTLGAIRFVVDGLRNLPGRKSVILLSDSLRLSERDGAFEKGMQARQGRGPGPFQRDARVMASLREITDLCNRASVVLYTIDPRGIQTLGFTAADQPQAGDSADFAAALGEKSQAYVSSQAGLGLLARETGGLFFHDNNDINLGLRRALQDQSGYYLIGYTPAESTFATKSGQPLFHKIRVQVSRRGVRVRTRTGFFGVPDRNALPAQSDASGQLLAALTSPFDHGEIHLRLTPLFSYSEKKGHLVHALLHIDGHDLVFAGEPGGWHEAVLDVVMMTFGDNGAKVGRSAETFKIRVHGEDFKRALENGLVFSLDHRVTKAGPYQFRCAVRDAGSMKVGSASEFIEVPDVSRGRLALSGILVHGFHGGNPGFNASAPESAPNPLESPAVRVFKPGDRLEWEVAILNAHVDRVTERPDVRLQLRLLHDGQEQYAGKLLPVDVNEQADMKRLLTGGSLRLGSNLAPGAYELELLVVDGYPQEKHRSAKQSIDFEVVP